MQVLKVALAGALLLGAGAAAAQTAPSGGRIEGFLTTVWGDPHPQSGSAGAVHFAITSADGARTSLEVAPELQSSAIRQSGKRVAVRIAAQGAQSAGSPARVEDIEPIGQDRQAAATGKRRVLFILLRFKNDTQTPHQPDFFSKLTNPAKGSAGIPATINGFFDGVSYGQLKWSGTVAGDKWYTLPKARTDYADCDGNSACFAPRLFDLADDAVALVKNDVDIDQFDNINFVFNNDLDCCAWGGGYSDGVRSWGATWEPPWGQETSTYVHELGHSLGLPHSGWRYQAYDSAHDQMSGGSSAKSVVCGTYDSVNFGGPNTQIFCNEPGSGYIMAHQDFLGWIPAKAKAVHDKVKTKTYKIQANAAPLGGKLKTVVVCLKGKPCTSDDPAGRFLTLEVKTAASRFDKGVPSEGVVIHDVMMDRPAIGGSCFFNDQSGWAVPFDAKTGDWDADACTGTGLANMAYAPGQTFKSKSLGVTVEVLSRSKDVFKVRVTKSK